MVESHQKKYEGFPAGIMLPFSIDFPSFFAGTGSYFLTWKEVQI
jgi:hypothetical protein